MVLADIRFLAEALNTSYTGGNTDGQRVQRLACDQLPEVT